MELLGRDPQLACGRTRDRRRTPRFGPGARAAGRGRAGQERPARRDRRARTRGGPAGRRRARVGARARRALRADRRRARRGRGRARRSAGRGALPAPPRGRVAAGAARRRSRCCWTTCTGPTRPRSSSSCTCLRRPVAVPALLVIAARPVGPAGRLLDAARSAPGWEQLALDPLDREARSSSSPAWPTRRCASASCARRAGIPLYLHELARVADRGDGALPPTLLAAIGFEVAALASRAAGADRGRGGRRRAVRPRAGRGHRGAGAVGRAGGTRRARGRRPRAPGRDAHGQRFDAATRCSRRSAHRREAPPASQRLAAVRPAARPRARPARGRGRAFVFRHPLVRRAVYDACAPGWRLGAHERAAAALERRGAGPAARAFHVVRSAHVGDPEAVAILSAAAEAAGEASPAAAAHWFGAALRLVPDREHDARSGLLAQRALALAGAGRLTESRTALLEALALAPAARADRGLARVETQLGLHADARRRLLAARADAPPDQHAALAFELAAGAFHEGRVAELRGWAEPAVQATQDDPLLLVGAEALLAPRRALGAATRRPPRPRWTRPPRASTRSTTRRSRRIPPCRFSSASPSSSTSASARPRRRARGRWRSRATPAKRSWS